MSTLLCSLQRAANFLAAGNETQYGYWLPASAHNPPFIQKFPESTYCDEKSSI